MLVSAGLGWRIRKTMLIKSAAGLDAAWRGARLCDMARAVVVGAAPTWITGIVVALGAKVVTR